LSRGPTAKKDVHPETTETMPATKNHNPDIHSSG
jgi:hypothetical protein